MNNENREKKVMNRHSKHDKSERALKRWVNRLFIFAVFVLLAVAAWSLMGIESQLEQIKEGLQEAISLGAKN